jgi:16S rRNA (guanine527-N7)-methyltransferase
MTEQEARQWLDDHFNVSRETWAQLERYVDMLLAESDRQNLIAESTKAHVWSRHIVDSAQLLLHAPMATGTSAGRLIWADVGAGAGLPGVIIALLSGYHVAMIEMRRKRAEFLRQVTGTIGIANTAVLLGKVESVTAADLGGRAAVVSARAFAPMERMIPSAYHLTDIDTLWLLPKGQNFENELDIARRLWHSDARALQSVTAPESAILMLHKVRK